MKFVHIADVHLDASFVNLDKELAIKKRQNQIEALKKVIQYIKENQVDYLFISGDLYEQETIKEETIKEIKSLFNEIYKTEIFIAPGNHDPYTKSSIYSKNNWSQNVHIFDDNIKKYSYEDIDIYGYGFCDYYVQKSNVENIEIENKNKMNILVVHGSLDTSIELEKPYNSISYKALKESDFNYIALGHIHKTNFEEEKKVCYPGSLISLGFDEIGSHGMIVGEYAQNELKLEYVDLDTMPFVEKIVDVSETDEENLINNLKNENFNENMIYKIKLIGKRDYILDLSKINKAINKNNVIKLKDETVANIDFEKIAKENNLKGYFAEEMLERIKTAKTQEEKEKIQKALEIGLEVI